MIEIGPAKLKLWSVKDNFVPCITLYLHVQVIPICKLKTNYKSFEAKRRLCSNYDIFLADKRLYQVLPRLLGKKFFDKKK